MISILDSYANYVADQMAAVNPDRVFGGIIQSRDFPQTHPIPGALYLIILGHRALDDHSTEDNMLYEFTCQWTWFTQGTDIAQDQVAANRGGRYRETMQIATDLRNANYPGFCAKSTTTVDTSTGVITQTPFVSSINGGWEMIRWSRLTFQPRQDQKSGIIYESATVRVTGYSDVDATVATAAVWPYVPPVTTP